MLTVQVLIVHHQRLFADVLSQALQRASFDQVAVATSLAELERVVAASDPDVAVVEGADTSPLALAGPLATLFGRADTRILLIGDGHTDPVRLSAGCDGVTSLAGGVDGLVHDIAEVARGHVLDRRSPPGVATLPTVPVRPQATGRARLTPRELDVLGQLVDGADNTRIAQTLQIRPNTVRTHVQNILMKLGVRSRLEAVSYAVRHGLVLVEEPGNGRSVLPRPRLVS